MSQVVLIGDSIFDNARYVPGGPAVIEQVRRSLPESWQATLLAVDGAGVEQVEAQLTRLPRDASHLVVSAGGNNALDYSNLLLHETATSYNEVLTSLAEIRGSFQQEYRRMLRAVLALNRPVLVCTIYDSVPGLYVAEHTGLCLFNDVILREAFHAGIPVLDLRLLCTEGDDYARSSPIEPSVAGGGKIARALARAVTGEVRTSARSQVFA